MFQAHLCFLYILLNLNSTEFIALKYLYIKHSVGVKFRNLVAYGCYGYHLLPYHAAFVSIIITLSLKNIAPLFR